MPITLDISTIHCFEDKRRVERLNRLFAINNKVMLHSVTGATGCSESEALAVLLAARSRGAAEVFLLVYHYPHFKSPIMRRTFSEGFVKEEMFYCEECDGYFTKEEFFYDFEYQLTQEVQVK